MAPTLFCKPGRDGTSLGDCPFTHFARMAMAVAGKDYVLKPTRPDDKPEWLLEKHGGSMPCLTEDPDGGTGAVSESAKIAAAALPPTPADDDAMKVTKGLFPAIANFIKNSNRGDDEKMLKTLTTELGKLEKHLASLQGGPFLSGTDTLGLSDCFVATKLYVLLYAGGPLKEYAFPNQDFPKVDAYIVKVFSTPEFWETRYDEKEMVHGWTQARMALM